MRRYLSGFGPATANEIASWAGIDGRRRHPVARPPRRCAGSAADDGKVLVDLPGLAAARPPTAPTASASSAPGRPCSWSTPGGPGSCARRTARGSSASRTPHSFNTFLVDGVVEGTWRFDDGARRDGTRGARSPTTSSGCWRAEADALATFHDEADPAGHGHP